MAPESWGRLASICGSTVYFSVLIGFASPSVAGVTECRLDPTDGSTFISASMRIYEHEGFIHSVLLEAETDYGDTLPYLFACSVNCVMDMDGEDYQYRLLLSPTAQAAKTVTLEAIRRDGGDTLKDRFVSESCSPAPK